MQKHKNFLFGVLCFNVCVCLYKFHVSDKFLNLSFQSRKSRFAEKSSIINPSRIPFSNKTCTIYLQNGTGFISGEEIPFRDYVKVCYLFSPSKVIKEEVLESIPAVLTKSPIWIKSPSILLHNNSYYVTFRVRSSAAESKKDSSCPEKQCLLNYLYLKKFGADFSLMEKGEIVRVPVPKTGHSLNGVHDARLFQWNGDMYATVSIHKIYGGGSRILRREERWSCRGDGDSRDRSAVAKNCRKMRKFWSIRGVRATATPLQNPPVMPNWVGAIWSFKDKKLYVPPFEKALLHNDKKVMEKNWVPLVVDNLLYVITNPDPMTVLKCQTIDSCNFIKSVKPGNISLTENSVHLRGGTNFEKYSYPYYIGLTHTTTFREMKRYYRAHVVLLCVEPEFRIVYISDPVDIHEDVYSLFQGPVFWPTVQMPFFFPMGVIVEDLNSILISGHLNDQGSALIRLEGIKNMMGKVMELDSQKYREDSNMTADIQKYMTRRMTYLIQE